MVIRNRETSKLVRLICIADPGPELTLYHTLALIFAVLALGTVLDLKKQPFDPQALEYVHLARVSLVLGEDILQSRSFVVIQTLVSQRLPARVTMFMRLPVLTAPPCILLPNVP